jgi:hypothetical protein
MSEKNVHTEHCCVIHGCKYGDPDCPVENRRQRQTHLCEWCDNTKEQMLAVKDAFKNGLPEEEEEKSPEPFYGPIPWD